MKGIEEDEEDVALQAIEFWSTLSDYEIDLVEEGDGTEVCGAACARSNLGAVWRAACCDWMT